MRTRVSLLLFGLLLAACEEGPAPGPPAVYPPVAPPPSAVESPLECSPGASSELYVTRIAPLLRQDRPSSCSGCHLQGIDLAGFVRGSACQSMACLVDRRLVDLEDPANSHVLALIDRGRNKDDDARTRRAASAEYAGFYDWIVFSAACHAEVCAPMADPCGDGGGTPDALVAPPLRDAAAPDDEPVDAALADPTGPHCTPPEEKP